MKKQLKSVIVLLCICSIIAVLLALTNSFTAPIIEESKKAAANEALLVVMPEGKGFSEVDLSAYTLPATVKKAYKEANGRGYVFELETTGYGSGFRIMCGVSAEGIVTGAVCLSSNETLGHEKTYGDNFKGKDADAVSKVDTISSATKTTSAYRQAVTDALNSAIILGGGSVDIRTEEEILRDNLASALPSGEGKFTRLFITEVLDGVSAVYVADNGQGRVLVMGDTFVGIGADGKALGDADATLKAKAESEAKKLTDKAPVDVDLSAFKDLPKNLISVQKTESGNLVIETKGAGYGIKGGDDYHPASNEYIYIKACISADGKIIDIITTKQAETEGLGSDCEKESFYSQFVGKNDGNYTEIDAISGATMTTDGYKAAVRDAFATYKIITGGQH